MLEFIEFIVILFGLLCFGLKYYNHPINAKCKNHFKQMPLFNRVLAIWFTIFYAVPNKIYVNNNLSNFSTTVLIVLILVLSHVFPPFILLYIIFWIYVLESYFFAMAYENNLSFKKFINNKFFKGDDAFAKEYFSFFWGNMSSGGSGKFRSGALGSMISSLYTIARNQEKTHVRTQGLIENQIHLNNVGERPKNVEEAIAIQKKVENHIIERDTIILKTENKVYAFGQKVWDWFTNF